MRWTPTLRVSRVTGLSAERLRAWQVTGLLLDLDNTLAPWNDPVCPDDVGRWLAAVRGAGIRVMVVSNNGPARVGRFAATYGLHALARAGKPRARAFRRALAQLGTAPQETLAVGDRWLMDVVGGNRVGLRTVLVEPLSGREFWGTRAIRWVETRFLGLMERKAGAGVDAAEAGLGGGAGMAPPGLGG